MAKPRDIPVGAPATCRLLLFGATLLAALAITAFAPTRPLLLWNTTPSEPEGVYARTSDLPGRGTIVAFKLPAAGSAYANLAIPSLKTRSILKAVAAGPGDLVCVGQGGLAINGEWRAPIASRDRANRELPHWTGCRVLRPDELFVFSARVPNSFDSRYFGPVSKTAVLGVYRLVLPAGSERA